MKIWLKWVLLLGIGGFFLMAGLGKLADADAFARSILRYRLVGPGLASMAAIWLPWAEVLWALSLFSSHLRKGAIWLLFMLLCFFQVALSSAALRGLDIDCGCLGTIGASSVSFALIRNLALMTGLVILGRMQDKSK